MSEVIKFYSTHGPHGCFSNFSKHSVTFAGRTWATSEHAYQAQKFEDDEHQELVRKAKSAKEAAQIGRDRANPMRRNWDDIKVNIMYEVVKAKFTQHEDLKEVLLSTGDATLIEDSPIDYFWGCGADGSGKNMLGKVLMRLRKELQSK